MEQPSVGVAGVKATLDKYLVGQGSSNPGKKATATAASNYIGAVETCAAWHETCGLDVDEWQLEGAVQFGTSDVLDGMVRVVLTDPETGRYIGRVVLWDQHRCTDQAALLIAAAAIPVLDGNYPADQVDRIEVWQCGLGERFDVPATAARSASGQVATLLSSM